MKINKPIRYKSYPSNPDVHYFATIQTNKSVIMMSVIPRYGVRHIPQAKLAALDALACGKGIDGPEIPKFENQFAEFHGVDHAIASSSGRMAFYYILRAFDFPPNSEIIFPAHTYWVIPEMARVCGLRPVFVDIDPATFNISPQKFQEAISPRTVAVVPTHLYGQPCDMNTIMKIARHNGLRVIEDCAHALGARYHGQLTGTFGDAAFFSFQFMKGINTYGGGMAIASSQPLEKKIRELADAAPWPSTSDVRKRFRLESLKIFLFSRGGFTFGLFIPFLLESLLHARFLSQFLWQKVGPLTPLPNSYHQRFSNAQAIVGLHGLKHLESFNERSRANAAYLTHCLKDLPSVETPLDDNASTHIYYQYNIRVSNARELVRQAICHGIDLEVGHMDVCNKLSLFVEHTANCPVAESTIDTVQIPIYATLQQQDLERIVRVVRESAMNLPPLRSKHCGNGSSGAINAETTANAASDVVVTTHGVLGSMYGAGEPHHS